MSNEDNKEIALDFTPPSEEVIAEAKKIKPVWFFRFGNEKPFCLEEKAAWEQIYQKTTWRRQGGRIIGFSDGSTYDKIIRSSGNESREAHKNLKETQRKIDRYYETRDRLIFEDLLEEDDPKIKIIDERIANLNKDLDINEGEVKKYSGSLLETAFEAELKVAQENLKKALEENNGVLPEKYLPVNANIQTPHATPAQRNKILAEMPN